jgi:glutamate-ammonia-ligase adenylyltransferase
MQLAGRVPSLRTPQTLAALQAARDADLISSEDCDLLCDGWRTVSRMRNAVALARGKGSDHLPGEARERAAVASIMGYPPGSTDQMVNDYLRTTRRSRSVVDRSFWG